MIIVMTPFKSAELPCIVILSTFHDSFLKCQVLYFIKLLTIFHNDYLLKFAKIFDRRNSELCGT